MGNGGSDARTGGMGVLAAGLVIAGVFAAGVYTVLTPDTASDAPVAEVPRDPQPADALADDVGTTPTAEDAEDKVATSPPPSIDEVRLDGDGIAVIAGRAEPGADVSVRVDGEEIATAKADASGSFAAVGVVTQSDGARVVTLEATGTGEAVASTEDVILAPLAPPAGVPSQDQRAAAAQGATEPDAGATAGEAANPDTGSVVAAQDQTAPAPPADTQDAVLNDDAPEMTALAEPAAASPAAAEPGIANAGSAPLDAPDAGAPAPVAVLRSTAEGVELLQPAPQIAEAVAIDTIGYTDDGDVQLSGRAAPGTSEVRVYLDNRFSAALPVDSDGSWRGVILQVAAGLYRLRVDEVNGAGDVTSRIETPFQREPRAVLAEATADQEGPVTAVTVQTGDTLWAIARDRYGEGVLYVRVFEANRRDIGDPDLIYPGQVFDLPVD